MTYIVVNRDDMKMTDAEEFDSLADVQTEIMLKIRAGKSPVVYVEVPYDVNVKVKEEYRIEATKGKTKSDKSPGGEGDRKVRRGDEEPTEPVGEGSGDTGAGPGTKNK